MKSIKKLKNEYGKDFGKKIKEPIFFIEKIIGLKLTDFQKEWINLIEENDQVSIMSFRTSGKSEICFICYPIFKAFTQPKWQGIVVSETLPQSTEIIKRIKTKIQENELLKTSIPDSKKEASWSKTEIELKNGSRILSKPYSESIRGYHVNYVGSDEAGTYQDHSIFFEAIKFLTKAKNGKIVAVGTPKSSLDLLHKLKKRSDWLCREYPVLTEEEKSRWPERYSLDDIKKMEESDSLAFAQEMMCNPISAKDIIFPENLVKKTYIKGSFSWQSKPECKYFIGIDFSFAAGVDSDDYDYTVISVIEKTKKGELKLVNMERKRGLGYETQMNLLETYCERYEPIKVVADESRTGISFITDLRKKGVNVHAYKFTNKSKKQLITNLRLIMEKELLSIPRQGTRTKVVTNTLIRELQSFIPKLNARTGNVMFEGSGAHDDTVIALALSVLSAKKNVGSFAVAKSSRMPSSEGSFYVA